MLHVIATITVKPGLRDKFLAILKANVPAVLAEDGCLGYSPCLDLETGFPNHAVRGEVVTIVESWKSLAHLQAHLQAPHMGKYKQDVKDLVAGPTALQVVTPDGV